MTAEEVLMLSYGVQDAKQAQLMVRGEDEVGLVPQQLYSVPDIEDDEKVAEYTTNLADAAVQLQHAVAAGHKDKSTLKVINETSNFYLHGIKPHSGLDDIDLQLLKKMKLLDKCGNWSLHVIGTHNISDNLYCAVRVHVMTEDDLELFCNTTRGNWFNPECREEDVEGGGLNRTQPVSIDNERATISALRASIKGLLEQYPTSNEDDESLLLLPDSPRLVRAAITVRLREKILLANALELLDSREKILESLHYQVENRAEKVEKFRQEEEARAARAAALRELYYKPKPVVRVTIDLPPGSPGADTDGKGELLVHEGENLPVVVRDFIQRHNLADSSQQLLETEAKRRMPKVSPLLGAVPVVVNGSRFVLRVLEGQNATKEAEEFCLIYEVPPEQCDGEDGVINRTLTMMQKRISRPVRLSMDITAPDGRSVTMQLREGDQHAIGDAATTFAEAMKLGHGTANGVANALLQRMPEVVLQMPVDIGSGYRGLALMICKGDDVPVVVKAFCENFQIPADMEHRVLHGAVAAMNPGAHIVPLD